ncbi:MAG: esterase [Mycobacterium sp.]|nr:esterase [Mycobacterium sp.]
MGPTSNIVLAVLVLAIVAVVAATAVWWNRGALRRTRNGALLLLGQVLVATLLLAVVNDHEQFYTSWPEVFGVTPSGIAVTSYGAPLAGPLPASVLGTGPAGTLDRHLRALRRLQRGRGSMVTDIVLAGRRTGYRFPARLYLPQAYFSAEAAHRTFPVVELFAGGGGGPRSPFASLPLQQAFDRAIAAGTLPPLIAVAPTRNPIRFPDSQCLDDPRGLKVFTYLADDVPAALRTLLRVRPDRGGWVAMGNSSGGYCAANVAVRRPGQFATVVSLSGYFSRPLDGFPMRDPLVGAAARRANSPLDGLLHLRLPMNVIAVSALDDRSAMREIGALVRVLRHRPADHEDIITSRTGGHSSLPWRSTLPAIIGALGNDLRRSGADPTCAAPPTARHHPGPARRVDGAIRAGGANRAGGRLRRR